MPAPTNRECSLAALVHGAPLLRLLVWIGELSLPGNSWNFLLLFGLGLFLFAAGALVALAVAVAARRGFVRDHAIGSLRFQGWIALIFAAFAVAFAVGSQFDPPNPTMSNPPVVSTGVSLFAALFSAFILPLVEFGRAIVWGRRAWRGVSAAPNSGRVPEPADPSAA